MLRVMLLTTDLQRGGLPLRIAKLAPYLRGKGVDPVVGCLAPPGPLSFQLEKEGIETFACDARSPLDVMCLWRLAGNVRRFDPDVIHASLFHANLAARLVGRLDRWRPIVTSTVTIEIERNWHRWFESLTAELSDLHVANSEAVAQHLRIDLGWPADRLTMIPNGIDSSEVAAAVPIERSRFGIPADADLIVWAGRMDRVKNLDTFVDVVAELARRRKVVAVLLGDGPERPNAARRVRERGLDGVIRLALWSEHVLGWFKAADLVLFPSLTEGSPNVVLEALACGCPVLASDVPPCRELISCQEWLRHSGDVRGFALAAERLLGDKSRARREARRMGEDLINRHEIRHVAERWVGTYQSVVRKKPG